MSLLSSEQPALDAAFRVRTPSPRVPLLAAATGFAAAIPPSEHRLAMRVLSVPRVRLRNGEWEVPPRESWEGRATAGVVLDGILCRDLCLDSRAAAELFGHGDIVDLWSKPSGPLDFTVRWSALTTCEIAVLDGRFAMASRRWPGLRAVVSAGRGARAERLAYRTAVLQLPRVEERVIALLWEWADRWGRMTPEGVVVRVPVTHELIGRLVAARRPTVSLALAALVEQSALSRRDNGDWILDPAYRLLAT